MEYKLPKRYEHSNKATYGKVLNIAGCDYMPGAAYLSSISALKVGCGYCFLASTERVIDIVATQTSNVVFVPLNQIDENLKNADVVEIGCGLSTSEFAQNLFLDVIEKINKNKPLIIDADGLNILSKNRDIFNKKELKNVVITPHPKEASRLLNCTLEEILNDIPNSAKEISKLYNCVTVLKTHNTFVCDKNTNNYINTTGNSSMAKAGSGDVLAGIISGLIAQKMNIFEASCLGVYLQGLSGDLASQDLSRYCVMAQDLIDYLPLAVKKLDKKK